MSQPKPFVQVACVCEKVLTETDNVPSLIRIVDTYNLSIPDGKTTKDAAVALTAFVALKSGDVTGEHIIGMRLVPPAGETSPIRQWPVVFNGGEHGANLRIDFMIAAPTLGLYWFDVLCGDDVLTRIPFRLNAAAPQPNRSELSETKMPA